MISQITSNLRKSLCHVTSRYNNRICVKRLEEYLMHEPVFYCPHRNKSTILVHSNEIEDPKLDRNVSPETQSFKRIHGQSIRKKLDIKDLFLSKKYIEKLYPQPVSNLITVYDIVNNEFQKKSISFTYEDLKMPAHERMKCTIGITWPCEQSFSSTASNKKAAARNAAVMCLSWLCNQGRIKGLKPVLYAQTEVEHLLQEQTFVPIDLASEMKDEIRFLIDKFHNTIDLNIRDARISEEDESGSVKNNDESDSQLLEDMYKVRNNQLVRRMHMRTIGDTDLPILKYRHAILDGLKQNQVLLIKGDTGCGKSTQVPQFIIDEYIKNNRAHECNIIVTEPRRVAAISLAHRVAAERNEALGDTVGYHVRFNKVLPGLHGSVLFCTTGILLRRLEHDLSLEGVSHVIIDEAHERSLQTDMLLKLFKDMLMQNPHLKLIVMSATVNAELFQKYFSCDVVEVPGQLYPISMNFLEDIDRILPKLGNRNYLAEGQCPFDKIVQLIQWIIQNKPHGGILCFLPGWQEIRQLHELVEQTGLDNLLVLPLHSKIPNAIQQKVFTPAPPNVAKIILATDIAETGITIKDITYVIDTAVKREIEWNESKSLCSLNFCRVSRASISQRKGRAGRVRPGESYHFITRKEYEQLDMYPKAEILKTPLESAIIASKTYSKQKTLVFFNSMIESPSSTSLNSAVQNLQDLGVLDQEENLTSLGKRVSCFTLHPKLSKAIILSSIFKCLGPIVSIATVFSTFVGPNVSLDETSTNTIFKELKLDFHKTSDHIAILQYLNDLKNTDSDRSLFGTFKRRKTLSNIDNMQKLCMLHMEDLSKSRMISSTLDFSKANDYANNNELIRAIIFASTNHLIKRNMFGFKNGYFTKNANLLKAENYENIKLKSESVNYNRKVWPSDLLTYIHKMEYVLRRSCVVSDTSMISPLSVLLFSSGDVFCEENRPAKGKTTIYMDNIENVYFSCEKETADVLLKLRNILWNIVDFIIEHEGTNSQGDTLESVKLYKDELLLVVSRLLQESSSLIDKTSDA